MRKVIVATLSLTSIILGGCANTPDVTLGYYLPKSSISFRVIRTIACDADDNPIVATGVTPTVKHSADMSSRRTLALSGVRGTFSDSDVKLEYHEDGRLSGVNASSTGQGESILKTAITLATAVFAIDGGTRAYPDECADIKTYGGGKPLTITYEGSVDLTKGQDDAQNLAPDTASAYYADHFKAILGGVCAFMAGSITPQPPAQYQAKSRDVLLHLRQPGTAKIKLTAGPINGCGGAEIWNDSVPAAQLGTPYTLPIPAAALFGKQQFAVGITESGALKNVQYSSNTGAGQVFNIGSTALTALQGDTTAQKVAEAKAEADLIAQQQRLVGCLADPTTCK